MLKTTQTKLLLIRLILLGVLSLAVAGCSGVSKINPGAVKIKSSPKTPRHSMSKEEYPFDSAGNYQTEWAASGERKAGRTAYVKAAPTRGYSSSSSRKKSSSGTYTVRKGDTLWGIGRKYGKSVSSIKRANNLRSDNIRIGQRLRIP